MKDDNLELQRYSMVTTTPTCLPASSKRLVSCTPLLSHNFDTPRCHGIQSVADDDQLSNGSNWQNLHRARKSTDLLLERVQVNIAGTPCPYK